MGVGRRVPAETCAQADQQGELARARLASGASPIDWVGVSFNLIGNPVHLVVQS